LLLPVHQSGKKGEIMLEDLIYSVLWGGVIILVIFISMVIAFHKHAANNNKNNKSNSEFDMEDLLDRSDEDKKDKPDDK
tara:strand:+ start:371 stop:607 length:237 start_codon:yes stop_codon:yes gene_type:complete